MEKHNWWYSAFYIYLIFVIVGFWLVFLHPKGEVFLFINNHHQPWLDIFFTWTTYLGDGFIFLILIIFYLFKKLKYLLLVLIIGLWQGIIIYVLKKVIFPGTLRPAKYFEGLENLYLIPEIDTHFYNTFPSGHTTTAFSLAILVMVLTHHRLYSIISIALAIIAALSRVYLVQHFFVDIYVGSMVGIFCSLTAYYFVRWLSNFDFQLLEKPLIRASIPLLRK